MKSGVVLVLKTSGSIASVLPETIRKYSEKLQQIKTMKLYIEIMKEEDRNLYLEEIKKL